ncbi:hypothetical protein D3C85_1896360 [compost metagenome]
MSTNKVLEESSTQRLVQAMPMLTVMRTTPVSSLPSAMPATCWRRNSVSLVALGASVPGNRMANSSPP